MDAVSSSEDGRSIDEDASTQMSVVGVIRGADDCVAIGATWVFPATYLIGTLGPYVSRPATRRAIRWVSGTVLVGLGMRVALDRA